jgi:glycerol-3-phosphate dehydrogenase
MLDDYLQRAGQNGVAGVRKINADQIRTHEPNVRAHSALLVPTSGVFDPTTLLYKVFVLAGNRGVNFLTATEVLSLQNAEDGVIVTFRYRDGRQDTIAASRVINAAGLQAVELARSSDPDLPIRSALVRGDSYKFYRNARAELYLRGMNVYPTPIVVETPTGSQQTVGVHLTPTFDTVNGKIVIGDTVTVGPRLVPVKHLEDYRTPVPAAAEFVKDLGFFPGLQAADLQFHQGGIQARLNGYPDFYIQPDRRCSRILNVLGIDSPGLTAAPAIAKYVAAMMEL